MALAGSSSYRLGSELAADDQLKSLQVLLPRGITFSLQRKLQQRGQISTKQARELRRRRKSIRKNLQKVSVLNLRKGAMMSKYIILHYLGESHSPYRDPGI